MWIRSAFWVGKPKAGAEAQFRSTIDEVMVPGLSVLPGVQNVKALWPERLEDSPPDVACQILVQFSTREDVDLMLASAERRAMRVKVLALIELFDGKISHIDYSVVS